MHGVTVDSTMGVNTWAAFAGNDENAVVDGDFRSHGKRIAKGYWGRGSAQNLAQSIQKALLATVGTTAKPRASVR